MEKIKIIELLEMIHIGDVLPKTIKYANVIYNYKNDVNDKYLYIAGNGEIFFEHIFDLDDEIEIIEDKKIKELHNSYDIYDCVNDKIDHKELQRMVQDLYDKINEIIEVINDSKRNV